MKNKKNIIDFPRFAPIQTLLATLTGETPAGIVRSVFTCPPEKATIGEDDFAVLFPAVFPHVVLYTHYESHGRHDDDFYYNAGETYGKIPVPAPMGTCLTSEELPAWLEEHLFQYTGEEIEKIRAEIFRIALVEATPKKTNQMVAKVLSDFLNDYEDDGHYIIETETENYKRRMEAQRAGLEEIACGIAKKYGVSVNTVDFMTAVRKEVARQEVNEESRREGLREDGLCIGYGVTYSQWQEEYNSPLYALSEARVLLDWLLEFQPLMRMAWNQMYPNGLPESEIWEGGD